MLICGIKVTHDGAVALIEDNRLVFSVEMEKLDNNERHAHIDDLQVVFDCLDQHGYDAADVDRFVIDGWRNTSKDNKTWGGQQIRLDLAPYRRGLLSSELMRSYSFSTLDLDYLSYPHYAGHLASAYCTSSLAARRESSYVVCWDGPMFPYLYYVDAPAKQVRAVGPLFFLRGGAYHYLSQQYPPFDGPTSWAYEAALPGRSWPTRRSARRSRRPWPNSTAPTRMRCGRSSGAAPHRTTRSTRWPAGGSARSCGKSSTTRAYPATT